MSEAGAPIRHYDLCFGCGQANLFGLQLEVEPTPDGVAGRFFVKQDHLGAPGYAHGGVIAAALDEAMGLAVLSWGTHAVAGRLEIDLRAPAPVGSFVRVEAGIVEQDGRKLRLAARALGEDGEELAAALAVFVESPLGDPG